MTIETATFGAGCFWGVQEAFSKIPGVIDTTVGYMGGHTQNPTYEQVCTNTTGHVEVLQLQYDTQKISYTELLNTFWNIHDPTQLNRQGPDIGSQYRSVIFYHTESQKKQAHASKEHLQKSNQYQGKIVTQIAPATTFYPAEQYHQHYFGKKGITHQ